MELDDLRKQWAGLDGKLDAALRLNRRVLDERVLDKVGSAMSRLGWALGAELTLDVVAVLLTGSFVADHVREVRFLVPGLMLQAFAIVQIATLACQIVVARRIDYGAPLVEIQKRIGMLRVSRTRTTMWTLILAPLLWTPLVVVALEGLFGVDAYESFGVPYLVANVTLGIAVIASGLLVSRRYAARFSASPFARRLMRDLAGVNLTVAVGFLDSLAQFEADDRAT